MEDRTENKTAKPSITTAVDQFTEKTASWVDDYLSKHPPSFPRISLTLFRQVALIFLFGAGFGVAIHWIFQHIRNDTFAAGYQSRELEQFHRTTTYTNQLVLAVNREFLQTQKISFDGRKLGQVAIFKLCPGPNSPHPLPMQMFEQFTVEEQGNCENVNFPELGWTGSRDEMGEPVFYAWKGDHYERR